MVRRRVGMDMSRRRPSHDWNMSPKAVWRRRHPMKSVTKNGNSRATLRLWRLTLIREKGGYCEQYKFAHEACSEDDPDELHFAHVHGKDTGLKGMGRGMFYRLKDVFDHPDSYVLLCEEHHREYDAKK